jgi:hypothetical protein
MSFVPCERIGHGKLVIGGEGLGILTEGRREDGDASGREGWHGT